MTRRLILLAVAVLIVFLLSGASCGHMIRVDGIDNGIALVCARHDLYVSGDLRLTEAQRDAAIEDCTDLLALQGSKIDVTEISTELRAVCDRHNAYVEEDPNLSELRRETFTDTCTALMYVVHNAEANAP